MLPLPGAPSSSWAMFQSRLRAAFDGLNPCVCVAFWLFGEFDFPAEVVRPVSRLLNELMRPRADQQRPLCHYPHCCPRSCRSKYPKRRRSISRCHSFIFHEAIRHILHPRHTLLGTSHLLRRAVYHGHASHCSNPCRH